MKLEEIIERNKKTIAHLEPKTEQHPNSANHISNALIALQNANDHIQNAINHDEAIGFVPAPEKKEKKEKIPE